MAILWSTAARGSQVIPCVLIAGLPVILIPEGVTLTGWSAGALDAAWWPGSSFSGFSAYLKSWLSLAAPITWDEKAEPVQPEMLSISSLTVNVSDIGLRADGTGGLVTALFAARDSIEGTWITADVSTSATTVSVASTTGFASSGYLYLGRETMEYTSTTAMSFAVGTAANRGKFGSPIQHHWYVGTGNAAIANPEVTSGAPEIIGRTATVWLLEVSAAGVVTAGELAFYGSIGTGVVLSEDGETWTLRIDHAIKRLAAPLRGEPVAVGGFSHPAPEGARGLATTTVRVGRTWCPTYDVWLDVTNDVVAMNTLTRAAAAPDNGGWHATAEDYVQALTVAAAALWTAPDVVTYSLVGGKLRVFGAYDVASYTLNVQWVWDRPGEEGVALEYGGVHQYTSGKDFPAAWVPILAGQGSRVYLSAADYAQVPAVPSSGLGSVYYVLAFGEDDEVRYARITGRSTSGGLYWLDVDAITPDRVQFDALGVNGFGFIVTEPTMARIVCEVSATTWINALEALIEAFDTSLADTNSDAFDFDDMRDVAAQFPAGPYARNRTYVVDLKQSILELVTNECRLNGFTLVLRDGRITIARISDYAPTEAVAATISTSDLHRDHPRPGYSRGHDGIVNAMRFESPQTGVTVNIVDATSLTRYGAGRSTLEAVAPRQITGEVVNPAASYLELARQAATVLGPLRYPYEHVTLTTTPAKADLQVGELVRLDLWRVPDQETARGIAKTGQVIARSWTLYGGEVAAIAYTVRLSPARLAGWAPAALVDAGGISGSVVTLDETTFGVTGFGPATSGGGTAYFAVNDVVRLVEINATSPTASTAHTITAVGGSTLTLNPAPNATFGTLAADAVKVMVVPDDWGSSIVAAQEEYAYLADATYRLDASTRARSYAP